MNKKLLLSLSLALLSTYPIVAQSSDNDYIPLVQEGVRWEGEVFVEGWLYEHMEFHPYSIIIEGDTTINDIEYKKCHYLFPELTPTPNKNTIVAYLREDIDEQKVYALYEESYMSPINTMWDGDLYIKSRDNGFKEVLLYDFKSPENPDLYTYMSDWVTIDKTSIITTNDGISRRCHHIDDDECFIEGIGYVPDLYGDLLFRFQPMAACHCNTTINFKRFYGQNNTLVYSSPLDREHSFHESITRENVRWEYVFMDTGFIDNITTETTFWIEMKEKVVIDDINYKRCVAWSNDNDTITLRYVRDDEATRRVYCRYEYDPDNEILLYDYNDITQATPLQQLNTTFDNITKENFRYSYRNHDKFTIKDDAGNTQFQIIEGIGFISDGSTINNGHLLNYPYIEQPDSREYQITFSRLINTKNGSTIYEIPAGVDKITIDNNSIITYRNGMISTNEKAIIEIFNINGRKVASTHGMSLSIPNLYNGMYIVRITTPYQSSTTKILIK
ncbi:MAG: T9SS type A sorting domain-containing protein [Muribaculaceae bacterium]|nr:T9SS type A sorting domain-containing protein [Muribaculaceae bacterium]